jgi:hypothetical protein
MRRWLNTLNNFLVDSFPTTFSIMRNPAALTSLQRPTWESKST